MDVPAPSRARSPPRPVKKERKPTPPSPPQLIRDIGHNVDYQRLGFLGEGGFACVYEAQDVSGRRTALKVVSRQNLTTEKTRIKLYAEVRLHKMLSHPNIVGFKECFDDEENVYMVLELCEKGSMMDVLRKRKGVTEPEARYWLVQIIGACSYMHGENVIHRDLKLGNIFLDARMDTKVGDFGLAALIENEGDRKKTICGTPNYIAPEVLFDTANGHSFEVDVWSIGVVLYTLLIGKPPFQTKEIKAIYSRIKANQYEFPPEKPISPEAEDLVTQILTVDPKKRPDLQTILAHPWFLSGPFPSSLPSNLASQVPDFRHLTAKQSAANFGRVRTKAFASRPIATSRVRASLGPSVAQQEREFNRAVQPDSPLSALLSSARQPLLVSHEPNLHRGSPLHRKLAAASIKSEPRRDRHSPLAPHSAKTTTMAPVGEDSEGDDDFATPHDDPRELERQERELADQKARIVVDMADTFDQRPHQQQQQRISRDLSPSIAPPSSHRPPSPREHERSAHRPPVTASGRENTARQAPYPSASSSKMSSVTGSRNPTEERSTASTGASRAPVVARQHVVGRGDRQSSRSPRKTAPTSGSAGGSSSGSTFDAFSNNLSRALEDKAAGIQSSFSDLPSHPPPPEVFIVSWLDYCNKYGMGYALTDGSIGVHFNDSSSLVLAPDREHFDYLSTTSSSSSTPTHPTSSSSRPTTKPSHPTLIRRNHTLSSFPSSLSTKIYLLKHFLTFMSSKLLSPRPWSYLDLPLTKGMDFVQRYLRMKHVIVFKLREVLQFNFYDHAKVILSKSGRVVTYLSGKEGDRDEMGEEVLRTWSLEYLMSEEAEKGEERKVVESVRKKLRYVDVLLKTIRTGGGAGSGGSGAGKVEGSGKGQGQGAERKGHGVQEGREEAEERRERGEERRERGEERREMLR